MKILVADDDSVSRRMICNLLQRKGFETVEACDGFEALEHLQQPDSARLAVLDWIMPGMDGIEVCRRLRAEMVSHYVYVLLVTSRAQKSDLLTALEAGADDYLIKPFDFSELQVRLQVGRRIIQAEEQLRQAQRIEAMGLLTGGIAHDFNNIVMIVNSYCDIILDDAIDPELRSKAQQIKKAGQRAASLTHQLLAFSRKQVITPTVFNVNSVISDLTPMLQRLVGEQVKSEIVLAPDLWLVEADTGQLERMLFNLGANARDAMPHGGQLTIQTANVVLDQSFVDSHLGCKPGAYVMLSVEDNGCGMTKEVQRHAFDPFFTTKPKGQGTGMGLSSVYGVVKQSGGYISIESELGKGSTFRIYLPRCERESPASLGQEKHGIEPGRVVLVVEDEESTRDAICRYLNGNGYRAIGAGSAAEALAIYTGAGTPPSIVLTDILMPVTSGAELAREILRINPEAKLIFMSGYADGLLTREMESMERFRFLQKPFQLSELLGVISENLPA